MLPDQLDCYTLDLVLSEASFMHTLTLIVALAPALVVLNPRDADCILA